MCAQALSRGAGAFSHHKLLTSGAKAQRGVCMHASKSLELTLALACVRAPARARAYVRALPAEGLRGCEGARLRRRARLRASEVVLVEEAQVLDFWHAPLQPPLVNTTAAPAHSLDTLRPHKAPFRLRQSCSCHVCVCVQGCVVRACTCSAAATATTDTCERGRADAKKGGARQGQV